MNILLSGGPYSDKSIDMGTLSTNTFKVNRCKGYYEIDPDTDAAIANWQLIGYDQLKVGDIVTTREDMIEYASCESPGGVLSRAGDELVIIRTYSLNKKMIRYVVCHTDRYDAEKDDGNHVGFSLGEHEIYLR